MRRRALCATLLGCALTMMLEGTTVQAADGAYPPPHEGDFITPHFYEPHALPGTRYSFTGALTAPRQILPGGYISWVDPKTSELQQLLYVDPSQPPRATVRSPSNQYRQPSR